MPPSTSKYSVPRSADLLLLGIAAFAFCLCTLVIYSDDGKGSPSVEPAAVAPAPPTAPTDSIAPPSVVASDEPQAESAEVAVPSPGNQENVDSATEETSVAPEIQLESLKEEIRAQEAKAAQATAAQVEEQHRALEDKAMADLAQQKALQAAEEAAVREREAREAADKELKALRSAVQQPLPPKLPPPVPAAAKPVAAAPTRAAAAPAAKPERQDLNSTRALWEYLPPVESVETQSEPESWRERESVTPLAPNNIPPAITSGLPAWANPTPPGEGGRIQLIRGDTVWVSFDRKRTEQVRLGQRHSTLGALKLINGNSAQFEHGTLYYAQ